MEANLGKFGLYVLSVLLLSAIGILIYDTMGFNKFHMTEVSIFCDNAVENVGVTNTRSLEELKLYVNNRPKFDDLQDFKKANFFNDTTHVADCTQGQLFSKRWNGARSVKVSTDDGYYVVTVLTEHITLFEEP